VASSEEAKKYKVKHGHYPGEVVWNGVPRLTILAMATLRKADNPMVSGMGHIAVEDLVAEISSGMALQT